VCLSDTAVNHRWVNLYISRADWAGEELYSLDYTA
jgi:hypothetical protein